MWPQVLSSLAAGVILSIAAIMLNSPVSLLLIAMLCMMAWASYDEQLPLFARRSLTAIGLLLGVALWLYLLYLAI